MAKLLVTGVSEALPERRSSGHYSSPNDWALNLVLYNLLGKDLVGLFFLKKERKTIQQGSELDGNVATHLSAYMISIRTIPCIIHIWDSEGRGRSKGFQHVFFYTSAIGGCEKWLLI